MKAGLFILIFCLAVNPLTLCAQRKDKAGTAVVFQDVMSQINPKHKRWIEATVKEAKEKNLSIDEISEKAAAYTSSIGASESETEFFIGMAATLVANYISKDISILQSRLGELKKQKSRFWKLLIKKSMSVTT